ncbi:MAG: M1 family metallopeptidase [Flavobacteriales bacterium]
MKHPCRPIPLIACALALSSAWAQRFDPLHPPNTYRNADNPHYWKNAPPYEGYWQQDVHYRMKVRLDETTDIGTGEVVLTYWNNSPDTLREVFFHLYQNAYDTGSYLGSLEDEGRRRNNGPVARRGTDLLRLRVGPNELRTELDNTVLRAELPAPLAPGERITFEYGFRTHWNGWRRMKLFNAWGFKHYDGAHWYPRISVYDRKFGWDTQQHLGNELYGDFGTYDVELDMPNDMVVEATGWLQNEAEVLPPDLRARLDLRNFKDKPWNERPAVITPYDPAVRKVWKYHAENVHDFAFTADPTYRIGEASWEGIRCIAVAQEPHASGWQNAADYCAKVIRAHSERFGRYIYPKMVVADAADGMEYPMLTLDGGREPDYRGLFVHEIGHNWFYGMVGNNETYRAMLDEGFTQFLTARGLIDIDGDTLVEDPPANAWEARYHKPELARESEVYAGYMRDAIRDRLPPINTHSDEFGYYEKQGCRGGYGHVYYKTATMLYNLEYVLGDDLFRAAMQHYFAQWKVRHPYVEDFRQSIIDFTKVDLNWFFDQWIETDKRIDYAVKGVRHRNADGGQLIHLRRKGAMQMPLDLTVVARDGRRYAYHVPNTWFVKRTNATVLPRWIGYDELGRDHVVRVDVPSGIADVIIDTTYRLADAYQLDNSLRVPFETEFDHHVGNRPDRRTYEGFVRPDLWWNGLDGAKVGVHFHGDWMRYKHKLWFTAWVSTGMGQYLREGAQPTDLTPFQFNFRYENGTEKLLKGSSVHVAARHLDGLELYSAGLQWRVPGDNTELYTTWRFLLRRDSTDLLYLQHPDEWEPASLNSAWDSGLKRRVDLLGGRSNVRFNVRNSGVGSAFRYAQLTLSAVNEHDLGKLKLHTRGFLQFGTGDTPRESRLYLAGASPEELMEDKYLRAGGFFPYDWTGHGRDVNHLQAGGGLNLRGYAGYLAPDLDEHGNVILTYSGNSGASFSAELDVDGLVRLRPKATRKWLHVDAYLFGDVGSMGYRSTTDAGTVRLRLATPRADAGAGLALTVKKWGPLVDVNPLTIRFDMPLFLSNVPAGESEHFAFRYVVGIGRSF